MKVVLAFFLLFCLAHSWDVAKTPPMGWNSWNHFGCGVDADVLTSMAKAMISTGLSEVGYEYVNSDDCWMLAQRSASGHQIANPQKFPNGFAAVTSFIHSLGLKSGLYTAKGTITCDSFAASCDHEFLDAAQWADWGIDYVKDDACSACGNKDDNTLYATMWQAIQASKRPMVLTVEANPDDAIITKGGYGNAKRVGHDISPLWMSMVSLVDIASGLYIYAHNSTNPTYGGWWNDLDMIEIGNGPDFTCEQDAETLRRCQAHMTMWCLLKSPLILGNDLRTLKQGDPTLAVLSNKDAIDVNQDSLGIQGKRISVQVPKDRGLTSRFDNVAVIALCDPTRKTQKWFLSNSTSQGSLLNTVDDQGVRRCLYNAVGSEGSLYGVECDQPGLTQTLFTAKPVGNVPANGPANYTLESSKGSLQWNNQAGASGPWPGTRYLWGFPWAGSAPFEMDLKAAEGSQGSTVVASDHTGIYNDNLLGKVTQGGNFCLDVVSGGMLEVWAAPLSGGRTAVSLFNRSPSEDTITFNFADAGLRGTYSIFNIWENKNEGAFTNSYTATVPARTTLFLVLTVRPRN